MTEERERNAILEAYDTETRKHEIVFYGASNFTLWKTMEADLCGYRVQNHGFGGSDDGELIQYAQELLFPYEPRIVVFQTGSNDYLTAAGDDAEKIAFCMNRKREMFAQFHERLPEAHFLVLAGILLPGRMEYVNLTLEINRQLKALCEDASYMTFVDSAALTWADGSFDTTLFLDDQIHLTGPARIRWAQEYIIPALEQTIAEYGMDDLRRDVASGNGEQRMKIRNYRTLNAMAQKGQILFTGSSLMEGFPIAEMSLSAGQNGNGMRIYNRGVGGYTTDDFLHEIDTMLLDLKPSVVFLNIGTNDIRIREDGEDWLTHLTANYDRILSIAREALPDAVFYLMAYYPANLHVPEAGFPEEMRRLRCRENLGLANARVAALAEKYGYHYLDANEGLTDEAGELKAEYTIDGIHMYADGYRVVFENLRPLLDQIISSAKELP